jgi:hypothetical protein
VRLFDPGVALAGSVGVCSARAALMPIHDSTTTRAQINALEASTPWRAFSHSYTTRLPFIGHVA